MTSASASGTADSTNTVAPGHTAVVSSPRIAAGAPPPAPSAARDDQTVYIEAAASATSVVSFNTADNDFDGIALPADVQTHSRSPANASVAACALTNINPSLV